MSTHEDKLKAALERLDKSVRKIIETRGYTAEAKSFRALEQMIKEQLKDAITCSSTRPVR